MGWFRLIPINHADHHGVGTCPARAVGNPEFKAQIHTAADVRHSKAELGLIARTTGTDSRPIAQLSPLVNGHLKTGGQLDLTRQGYSRHVISHSKITARVDLRWRAGCQVLRHLETNLAVIGYSAGLVHGRDFDTELAAAQTSGNLYLHLTAEHGRAAKGLGGGPGCAEVGIVDLQIISRTDHPRQQRGNALQGADREPKIHGVTGIHRLQRCAIRVQLRGFIGGSGLGRRAGDDRRLLHGLAHRQRRLNLVGSLRSNPGIRFVLTPTAASRQRHGQQHRCQPVLSVRFHLGPPEPMYPAPPCAIPSLAHSSPHHPFG